MARCTSMAWIAVGFTAGPIHRGTKSTREAVKDVVRRRNLRMSPCAVTIQMSWSTAIDRPRPAGIGSVRYGWARRNRVRGNDAWVHTWPRGASGTEGLVPTTASAAARVHGDEEGGE